MKFQWRSYAREFRDEIIKTNADAWYFNESFNYPQIFANGQSLHNVFLHIINEINDFYLHFTKYLQTSKQANQQSASSSPCRESSFPPNYENPVTIPSIKSHACLHMKP